MLEVKRPVRTTLASCPGIPQKPLPGSPRQQLKNSRKLYPGGPVGGAGLPKWSRDGLRISENLKIPLQKKKKKIQYHRSGLQVTASLFKNRFTSTTLSNVKAICSDSHLCLGSGWQQSHLHKEILMTICYLLRQKRQEENDAWQSSALRPIALLPFQTDERPAIYSQRWSQSAPLLSFWAVLEVRMSLPVLPAPPSGLLSFLPSAREQLVCTIYVSIPSASTNLLPSSMLYNPLPAWLLLEPLSRSLNDLAILPECWRKKKYPFSDMRP